MASLDRDFVGRESKKPAFGRLNAALLLVSAWYFLPASFAF
jgi:hypothetical protein